MSYVYFVSFYVKKPDNAFTIGNGFFCLNRTITNEFPLIEIERYVAERNNDAEVRVISFQLVDTDIDESDADAA